MARSGVTYSHWRPVLFLSFLVLLFPSVLSAQIAVATGEFPPYTSESLPGGGPLTQIVVEAFEAAELTVETRFLPWARGYRLLLRGEMAAAFPYILTAEREEEVEYSEVLYTAREVVVSAREKAVGYDGDPSVLSGLRYCLPLGFAVQPELESLIGSGDLTLLRPDSIDSCALLVSRGRADFYVPNMMTFHDHSGRFSGLVAQSPPLSETENHLIVRKDAPGSQQLLRRFNIGLRALKESGRYEEILAPGR